MLELYWECWRCSILFVLLCFLFGYIYLTVHSQRQRLWLNFIGCNDRCWGQLLRFGSISINIILWQGLEWKDYITHKIKQHHESNESISISTLSYSLLLKELEIASPSYDKKLMDFIAIVIEESGSNALSFEDTRFIQGPREHESHENQNKKGQ